MLPSHIRALVKVLAAPLQIYFLANEPVKTEEGPGAFTTIQMKFQTLQPGLAPADVVKE